jgi:ech hydrogenase subunit E
MVRILEIYQSLDLIRQCLEKMPDGEVAVSVKGNPQGEFLSRLEQPRGEAIYYGKANGTKYLDRFRVRTATFANIIPLLHILPGCDMADVPLLALTIDPCISCTER